MKLERERRFQLTAAAFDGVRSAVRWDPPTVVTDMTMGPDGPVSMRTVGWIVRLRATADKITMEFKGRSARARDHFEAGVGVDSWPAAVTVLTQLGLRPGLVISRERRRAVLPGVELALDDVAGLGLFLEIESTDDSDPAVPAELGEFVDPALECGPYGDLILDRLDTDAAWAEHYVRTGRALIAGLHPDGRARYLESAWLPG